jgi:hypothetical protein
MAGTCVFCGATGGLTGEHVFGSWLTRIGLDLGPVVQRAGPLNRIPRDLGITRPFRQKVRDVCGTCNHGWMSQLEDIARQVLTPLILGDSGTIDLSDRGAVAAWMQKTALVAMLVSSEDDRARGYGLPQSEYRDLYDRRESKEPLPATHVWFGRYEGEDRTGTVGVVPIVVAIEGERDPDQPQGYAMTVILGKLLFHGVRFTTPSLHLELSTDPGLSQVWPVRSHPIGPLDTPVDDETFLRLSEGSRLRVAEPHVGLRPWKVATELEGSRSVGSMVGLPTACGEHVVYYPRVLVDEAMRGRFYAFITSCECDRAYLIQTESNGAHCKAAAPAEAVEKLYEELKGDEYVIEDEGGSFVCKRLP